MKELNIRERILPIGTVVRLNESNKRLMIVGYGINKINNKDKTYDYAGVLFPQGTIVNNDIEFFNNNDIIKVDYYGLEDDTAKKFVSNLKIINNSLK